MSDPRAYQDSPWRRWQPQELQQPRQERPFEDQEHQAAIRRRAAERSAELDAERERAREEGYRAGLEEGRQAGHAEGHAEGHADGRQAAEQEFERRLDEALAPLAPLAERFSEALAQLDDEIADSLVGLALATGRQLAGEALEARPEQVLEIVRELLHVEPALSGHPRLWLHPDDLTLVEATLKGELDAAGWTLQPDDQLSRGGCRVNSASGELDASWESRCQAVSEQIRRRLPKGDAQGEDTPPSQERQP